MATKGMVGSILRLLTPGFDNGSHQRIGAVLNLPEQEARVEHTGHVERVQFQRMPERIVSLRDGLVEPVPEVTPVLPVPRSLLLPHGQRVVSRISHPGPP